MAARIAYTGNIVTNGLVLNLDAGKVDSYPRRGTVWRDLSGRENNLTLTNGPVFNSGSAGSVQFDGVNDYVSGSTTRVFITGSMTYEIVFRANVDPAAGPLGSSDIVSTIPYFYLDYRSGNLLTYHYTSSPQYFTVQALAVNTINHFVCTRNGLVERNYVNGVETLGRTLSNNFGDNNGFGFVGGYPPIASYFNCNVYSIKIYNRPLSSTEVSQNFNALRGRYGI